MSIFYFLFPALMLAFPAVFTLFVRRHPELSSPDAGATRRLWIATSAALLLHLAVQTWLTTTDPVPEVFARAWPLVVAVAGNMLLWFRFAAPVLASRQPGWNEQGPTHSASRVRTASLVARDKEAPLIGRTAWTLGWVVFVACAVTIIWAIIQGAPPLLCMGLMFWLGMGVGGSAQLFTEPEPLDPQGSAAIVEAYAKLRAFRQWGFYTGGLAGTLVFTGIAVLTVYRPGASGLVGAIAGSAVGLLGAVFGTMASIYRVRVNNAVAEAHAAHGVQASGAQAAGVQAPGAQAQAGGAQAREGAASG